MKLVEIKNNLVKLSYNENETPILGRFIILASELKSYVAQFVNLKSDNLNDFAIARLLFTFTPDGVVDNYDGSIPGMESELSFLSTDELLDLMPINTPIKIANLAQLDNMLSLDISIFEHNLTVFAQRDTDKVTFISNCARQLFQMKEKCVIIDTDNIFEDYSKLVFAEDFKLPFNSEMIDYIFEQELTEVDASTKAVIQDIFYEVQKYIKTLDHQFIPIDNFVDVVAQQYKETQMPELALLKNKLLKYRDANVFANTTEEAIAFSNKLNEKNCTIIDLKNVNESLQREIISFIHGELEKIQKYIYFFTPLTDENSDKKLLKRLINHNHVFTTILTDHSYKYAQELKNHAENIILFAPQTLQHDFASYNTFLNKLNLGECVVYGKLTQGIPFIADMTDLDLDLTWEDVFGEKFTFFPTVDFIDSEEESNVEEVSDATGTEMISSDVEEEFSEKNIPVMESMAEKVRNDEILIEEFVENVEDTIENNFDEDDLLQEEIPESELNTEHFEEEEDNLFQESPFEQTELTEDDLNYIEETQLIQEDNFEEQINEEEELDETEEIQQYREEEPLEEEIEVEGTYVEEPYIDEQPPVVPVYPVDDSIYEPAEIEFVQGDSISHPRYGRGVIEKIIKYGNKTLCSISFENVGRRLLDPSISEFVKL